MTVSKIETDFEDWRRKVLTGVTSQKQLEGFLAVLKPRQRIKIVFSEGHPEVARRMAYLVTSGLLAAPPMVTAMLYGVSQRGEWGSAGQTFEFELANEFVQPEASWIVAEAIWFGVGAIEVVEG